ncbi:MAG: hypothetical protein M3270_10615, partial [Thermoproteota archaeon]|nr:hypothetical protein [Thermoproteota archaeon]
MENEQHEHFVRHGSDSYSQANADSTADSSQGLLSTHAMESHNHSREHHHSAHLETGTSVATPSVTSGSANYNVNVQFDPAIPLADKPTHLSLIVTEQKVGEPIKQFDVIHDKLMHLIIVNSEDLSHFAHVHPTLDKQTGIFHIAHAFAKAGKYKMWIDVKPKGGTQTLAAFAFHVEGQPVHIPAAIVPEQRRIKNVIVEGQVYQVALNCEPGQLVLGKDIKMTFEIKDANGKPISNLEPLMAAGGHCVIIDADAHEFLHVHPAEEIDDVMTWRGGPSVSFVANFPKPGLYRAWGQF